MAREHEQELAEIDNELERLKVLYDQYFLGIERVEPTFVRNKVLRSLRLSKIPKMRNTALMFRFRGLSQKFATYTAYWDRMVRMMEDGSFDRGRTRAPNADHPVMKRRLARATGADVEGLAAMRERRRQRRRQRVGREEPEAAAAENAVEAKEAPKVPAPDLTERVRNLYDEYLGAKKANGENVSRLSFDVFERSITKTRAAHLAKFQCDDLDYKVRVREGKVSLVAQPHKA